MYDRLYSFLEKKESLYEHQFGFRNNRSTTHALIEITENIRKSCNKGLHYSGVLVYLKNHSTLQTTKFFSQN